MARRTVWRTWLVISVAGGLLASSALAWNTPTPTRPPPTPTRTPTPTPPPPTPSTGGDGCTPGFWKQEQHFDSWPAGYLPGTLLKDVFDLSGFTNLNGDATADDTLLDGLKYKGGSDLVGAAQILLRAGVAALLNAASSGYPLTKDEVIEAVNDALASDNRATMLALASRLDSFNNLGCPFD